MIADTYTITVTDINGDTYNENVIVSAPKALAVTIDSVDTSCGDTNGEITINATDGTPPYIYYTVLTTVGTALTAAKENSFNLPGLSAGTYETTVTDANSDTVNITTNIALGTDITFDLDLTFTIGAGVLGDELKVTGVSGGVPAITYRLFQAGINAAVLTNTTGEFKAKDLTFTSGTAFGSVPAGNYKAEIEDTVGCLKTTNTFTV